MIRSRIQVWSAILAGLVIAGCGNGIEPSPGPGILRVTIKANELDTTIVIGSDTSRFSRWDNFQLFISQGRLDRGGNYALLYANPSSARVNGDTINILARKWLDGTPITTADTTPISATNSRYRSYVIFESNVPPGDYSRLEMSLIGKEMDIFIPKIFQNPIQLPESTGSVIGFLQTISVREGGTTEINLEIDPFSSLQRYRDLFVFSRQVRVTNIRRF